MPQWLKVWFYLSIKLSLKLEILNLTEKIKLIFCTSLYLGAEGWTCWMEWTLSHSHLGHALASDKGLSGGGTRLEQWRGGNKQQQPRCRSALIANLLYVVLLCASYGAVIKFWVKSFTEIISLLTATFISLIG